MLAPFRMQTKERPRDVIVKKARSARNRTSGSRFQKRTGSWFPSLGAPQSDHYCAVSYSARWLRLYFVFAQKCGCIIHFYLWQRLWQARFMFHKKEQHDDWFSQESKLAAVLPPKNTSFRGDTVQKLLTFRQEQAFCQGSCGRFCKQRNGEHTLHSRTSSVWCLLLRNLTLSSENFLRHSCYLQTNTGQQHFFISSCSFSKPVLVDVYSFM